MARFTTFLLLALVVTLSALSGIVKGDGCTYMSQIPGGCPDSRACKKKCKPCYRGVGSIESECVAPGGGNPYWECRCWFKNGAPCPTGPPACPKPPTLAQAQAHLNQTL